MKTQIGILHGAILSRAATVAVLLFWAVFLTLTSPVLAGKGNAGNPAVIPPHASTNGYTYAEWSAMWWQWALGIPVEMNPLLDDTGEDCGVDQDGSVWFLAGNFGGESERYCTIPAGRKVFFPVINQINVTTCEGEPRTRAGIRPLIAPFIDAAEGLLVEVDGVMVKNLNQYRVASPLFCTPLDLFGVVTPEDLELVCDGVETAPDCSDLPNPGEHFGSFEGFGPAMSDGYWIMLKPLSVGEHTIYFTATNGDFELDVIYYLTVVPGRR